MRITWTADWETAGVAFGYSTHQKMLKAALVRQGVVLDDDAEVAVHLVTPQVFEPIPGRRNVLYTMYEMKTIPAHWIAPINQADLLVVPCTHNKELFSHYLQPELQPEGKLLDIEVVTEGVDTDVYTFVQRQPPKLVPFRFLWVGASNARKGYAHVVHAWNLWRQVHSDLISKTELYMKTTQTVSKERVVGYDSKFEPQYKLLPRERVVTIDNAIVDTRKLPFTDGEDSKHKYSMQRMYHDAHAFLLPSMGEGFGLTLAEAMSTGLPCIYTPWSGPEDFCDETVGFPVQYRWSKVSTAKVDETGMIRGTDHESEAASPTIESIVARMEQIYFGYRTALKVGKAAAERIRAGFTWDISARLMMDALRRHYTPEQLGEA